MAILWNGPDINQVKPHHFLNETIFAELSSLESLIINIPTDYLVPSILKPLKHLSSLDLSQTGYLQSDTLASVINESELRHKPFHRLVLRCAHSAVAATIRERDFLMSDLIYLLDESNITLLDFSENDNLLLTPGLIKFLPNLHELRIARTLPKFMANASKAQCLLMDIAFHPSITVLDISGVKDSGYYPPLFDTQFMKIASESCQFGNTNCTCSILNNLCSVYVGTVGCDAIPSYALEELFDMTCMHHFKYPLPTNLETVYFNATEMRSLAMVAFINNKLCFKENKLRVLDFQGQRFPRKGISNFSFQGLQRLEKLTLDQSTWSYFWVNHKFIQSLYNLQVLKVSSTNIGVYIRNDTENQVFLNVTLLKELHLSNAFITYIPHAEFSSLNNLEILNLSNNGLEIVTFNMEILSSLKHLDLSQNRFNTFTENITQIIDSMKRRHVLEIDLSHNDLQCDCASIAFIRWIKNTPVHFKNKDTYTCRNQEHKLVLLSDIRLTELTYHCNEAYITSSI